MTIAQKTLIISIGITLLFFAMALYLYVLKLRNGRYHIWMPGTKGLSIRELFFLGVFAAIFMCLIKSLFSMRLISYQEALSTVIGDAIFVPFYGVIGGVILKRVENLFLGQILGIMIAMRLGPDIITHFIRF